MSKKIKNVSASDAVIKHREPLIHINKRDTLCWWKAWCIRAVAIIAALIVCAVIIVLITGYNPLEVYASMFKGTFGTSRKVWITLQNIAMLLCIALAVTPAFKMKFWNLGAEGQVLMGALAAAGIMITLGKTAPSWVIFVTMIPASILSGIIWAVIPAYFKAKWGTNESLFTLMMNYVAMQLVSFCVTFWENPKGSNAVGIINQNTQKGWIPTVFGEKYFLNVLIVVLLTVALFIYLKYTKHGYEISVVGESEKTARYIGINVKKVILRTMAVSGALCGVAGFLLVSGASHTVSSSTAGGQGFTAIMVSWLAKFNPIVMMLTTFLLVFLERGAGEIVTATSGRLNASMSEILSGIILFFIIGCEFFINYKIVLRRSKKEV